MSELRQQACHAVHAAHVVNALLKSGCQPFSLLAGGNIRLVAGLAEGLPILYNSVVRDIHYSESRVRVSTASKSFEGESLIIPSASVTSTCKSSCATIRAV